MKDTSQQKVETTTQPDTLSLYNHFTQASFTDQKAEALVQVLGAFATREDFGALKKEMYDFKAEMKQEMHDFKIEMKQEMHSFRTEMRQEMRDFKTEIKQEVNDFKAEIKSEIQALGNRIDTLTRFMFAMLGFTVAGLCLSLALSTFLVSLVMQ